MTSKTILIKKANTHNLKAVDLALTAGDLVVFTGVSGSGKSSLAFDTLYAEGQRRYVESLSHFARRYLGDLAKPDVESIEGISPTISIEQKTAGRNPRSTVGTMTEVYDYLRVLYARVAIPHCPVSGEPVTPQSRERIIRTVQGLPTGSRLMVLAPYARSRKGEFKDDFQDLLRKGYMRVRVDGVIHSLGETIALDGNLAHDVDVVMDRITVTQENFSRLAEGITHALELGEGVCSVWNADGEEETLFSMHAYSVKSGLSYPSLEPQDFSFNSPVGMCERCSGLGVVREFDAARIIDPEKSIAEDCCSIASSYETVRYGNIYRNLAEHYSFDVHTPWKELSKKARHIFLYGAPKKWLRMRFVHPVKGTQWSDYVHWRGVLAEAHHRYSEAKSEVYRSNMDKLMTEQLCEACGGERLKPYPRAALLGGKRLAELTRIPIAECMTFLDALSLAAEERVVADELLKEIQQRLRFLLDVGLGYLTLDRSAPTLSGGEAQRVRLASQIGCGLVGVTYVLDEPSIGLHPRDNRKLIQTLRRLRDKGNTVVVVEHDEETMWAADHVVDFGPGAGVLGGEVVAQGSLMEVLDSDQSLTAKYLRGDERISVPSTRRKPQGLYLEVKGAEHHNLKKVNVKIPIGVFVCVTGVSGSGKSSLILEVLYPALANHLQRADLPVGKHRALEGLEHVDKVIAIDQSPIGINPRSNPATYVKIFDEIRDLFAQLPESQARGYTAGRFSFNVKEGSCSQCQGMGMIRVDMDFMEAAWVDCPLCHTRRYDPETLSIYYKGKTIFDVLDMDVDEALEFFQAIPSLKRKLSTLSRVGLGYVKLGQSSPTLSGGEAQRVKLAKELVRPASGRTVYILDEPTTGLHFHDIRHLLEVLHELTDRGNTVVVIEHNMEVVKTADWILDLGPEGGEEGGRLVASGRPELIAKKKSPTGEALREVLEHDYARHLKEARRRWKEEEGEREQRRQAATSHITITGAEQHNLKHLDVAIPRERLTVCTGPSGSGKSSLAFDTLYAEGQRRYIESLSPYARQFVKQMAKPKVEQVEGLSPAVAIEQKTHAGNPRSTVGTQTEIYDYLRLLYARVGLPHCPDTGEVIQAISKEHVVDRLLSLPEGERLQVLAPILLKKGENFQDLVEKFRRMGYLRLRLNGEFYELDGEIPFTRKRKNEVCLVIDRLKMSHAVANRLFEAVENASNLAGGKLIVMREEEDLFFNLTFSVASTGKSYPEITPKTFAFNTPEGMCPDCQGLGFQYGASLMDHADVLHLSPLALVRELFGTQYSVGALRLVERVLTARGIDPYLPLYKQPSSHAQFLFQGDEAEGVEEEGLRLRWQGINGVLIKAARGGSSSLKEAIVPLLDEVTCRSCQGSRLNALARHVTLEGRSLPEICALPIGQLQEFMEGLSLAARDRELLEEVIRQLRARLLFLCEVGLHYLSLDRMARTLSGGETQRIRLARQLGSSLTGVLYVLDEPTIGLHPEDTWRLSRALRKLKELGNTLVMVEHDPVSIREADHILDFGPHAGEHGGHITAQGSLEEILHHPGSLTGAYLRGEKTLRLRPYPREASQEFFAVEKARVHNLKGFSLQIPIGRLTCLTGVSGSGKSSLMHQVLVPALRKGVPYLAEVEMAAGTLRQLDHFSNFIVLDQNPIGQTIRSDVGTYAGAFTKMREFFASLPEAKAKGLRPKHFSYNHRAGMCSHCWGMGYKKVEMHFLPPVKVPCPECRGLRLNSRSLEVTFRGKNLGQYLESTVDEARMDFENIPSLKRNLDTLREVGLGYLKLGQAMVTLSGGEAQRIRLSRELGRRSTGKTLYLLDEPTTGLHLDDMMKLLNVIQKLVDKGNTFIVIEHNMDFVKNADYVVDLGPGSGEAGGQVVAVGTPEEVAQSPTSITGPYLK